ncbi:hypothetical protein ACHAXT_007165 [Thalassiosira profunda]
MSNDAGSVSSGGNLGGINNMAFAPSSPGGAPLGSIGGATLGAIGGGGGAPAGSRLLQASSNSPGDMSLGLQQQQQQPLQGVPLGSGGMGGTVIGGGAIGNPNINLAGGNLGGMMNATAVGPAPTNAPSSGNPAPGSVDELHLLVLQLVNHDQREGVLLELSKKRESFPDLAPILWHTVGTVAALLQEIVSIYPLLTPPTLTAHASNRVCNALALLQCVASHPDTRGLFLNAHVPLYLYPFLNTQSKSRPFEYLRLTSLGVIGALVKMDDADVINFLLQTEIIPLCLRIMEAGSELSKTVATFIVQKILLDDVGLGYVCATAERFYAVSTVLNNMVGMLVHGPSVRLLKHIVRCYLRLSDNQRARDALKQALPSSLRDNTFANALRDDVTVKKWLSQLLAVVGPAVEGPAPGGGMPSGDAGMGGPRLAMGGGIGLGGAGGGLVGAGAIPSVGSVEQQ